jgi:serine protease Do
MFHCLLRHAFYPLIGRSLLVATLLSGAIQVCRAQTADIGPNGLVSSTPSSQQTIDALSRANQAVVGVKVLAAEDARSIQTLGRQRVGSGVVIGADGLVLTIGYLMLEADTIELITQDKKSVPARAVAYDLATGFGLIRPLVPLTGIQPVVLGSAAQSQTGESLIAGTGAQLTSDGDADVNMTQLMSKRAFTGYWEYHIDTALFTSPPMPNHSGAPLFNQRGELLGIGSLFVADVMGQNKAQTARQPGNMFVPIDLLKPIMAELTLTGSSKLSKRPWIGLTCSEQGGRIQVIRVAQEGPAQAAGLKPGDVVLAIDDAKVATLEAFYKKLWDRATPDVEVNLTVLQGTDQKTLALKPVDRMSTMRKPAGI